MLRKNKKKIGMFQIHGWSFQIINVVLLFLVQKRIGEIYVFKNPYLRHCVFLLKQNLYFPFGIFLNNLWYTNIFQIFFQSFMLVYEVNKYISEESKWWGPWDHVNLWGYINSWGHRYPKVYKRPKRPKRF